MSLQWVFVAKKLLHAAALASAYMRGCIYICCGRCGMHQTGVLSTNACAVVYTTRVFMFDFSVLIFEHILPRVCTCTCVCAVCSIVLGDEGGEIQ